MSSKIPSIMSTHYSQLILQDKKIETSMYYNFIYSTINHLPVPDAVLGKVREAYKQFIVSMSKGKRTCKTWIFP